ncbi:MAG: histidinol-phosphate aminotransferase family protein [Anaerolineales bacterium]|nr:histidinol-phosphate aminotransferase family protein [Anaerolineales bacterium]
MIAINETLFDETTHSPSLIDLVGYAQAHKIVDFCFIANPYYPTEAMVAELARNLPELIRHYPSSNPLVSARHLAAVLHVEPAHLIIGNGATELITELCHRLVSTLGVPIPTFGEYIEKVDAARLRLYPLQVAENYQLDLKAYLTWVHREGLHSALVINPHNPTGQLFTLPEMHAFLTDARDLDLVIVDESFIDFASEEIPSLLHTADQYENLVLVRSMSKHCGVPGLRLGYCYSRSERILGQLRDSLPTWNLNTLAEFYLSLLPSTDADYQASRLRVLQDVRWLSTALAQVAGVTAYPTGANFVCFRVDTGMTARQLQRRLLVEHGLYVRDCSNKAGMDRFHIRVASQGRENDQRLVAALTQVLHAA